MKLTKGQAEYFTNKFYQRLLRKGHTTFTARRKANRLYWKLVK